MTVAPGRANLLIALYSRGNYRGAPRWTARIITRGDPSGNLRWAKGIRRAAGYPMKGRESSSGSEAREGLDLAKPNQKGTVRVRQRLLKGILHLKRRIS